VAAMNFIKDVLIVAHTVALVLKLSSSWVSYLPLFAFLFASATFIYTFRQCLRTAYSAYKTCIRAFELVGAFFSGELVEEAYQQLKAQAIKLVEDFKETARQIFNEVIVPLGFEVFAVFVCVWGLLLAPNPPVVLDGTCNAPEEHFFSECHTLTCRLLS
jgi:hypothetical protein